MFRYSFLFHERKKKWTNSTKKKLIAASGWNWLMIVEWNSFQWSEVGYNCRYVFFHSTIKVYFIKKNAFQPWVAETNKVSEEGSNSLSGNDSLTQRNKRISILINGMRRLTPAAMKFIKMKWDMAARREKTNYWMKRSDLLNASGRASCIISFHSIIGCAIAPFINSQSNSMRR